MFSERCTRHSWVKALKERKIGNWSTSVRDEHNGSLSSLNSPLESFCSIKLDFLYLMVTKDRSRLRGPTKVGGKRKNGPFYLCKLTLQSRKVKHSGECPIQYFENWATWLVDLSYWPLNKLLKSCIKLLFSQDVTQCFVTKGRRSKRIYVKCSTSCNSWNISQNILRVKTFTSPNTSVDLGSSSRF